MLNKFTDDLICSATPDYSVEVNCSCACRFCEHACFDLHTLARLALTDLASSLGPPPSGGGPRDEGYGHLPRASPPEGGGPRDEGYGHLPRASPPEGGGPRDEAMTDPATS